MRDFAPAFCLRLAWAGAAITTSRKSANIMDGKCSGLNRGRSKWRWWRWTRISEMPSAIERRHFPISGTAWDDEKEYEVLVANDNREV